MLSIVVMIVAHTRNSKYVELAMAFPFVLLVVVFSSAVVGGVIRENQLCSMTQSDKSRTHALVLENDCDTPMEYLFSEETMFTSGVKREILMPGERKNAGCSGNDPDCHASYKLVGAKLPAIEALHDRMTVSERYEQLVKDENHTASSHQEIAHARTSTPSDHSNASDEAPRERTPASGSGNRQVCTRCGHIHPDSDMMMALRFLESRMNY